MSEKKVVRVGRKKIMQIIHGFPVGGAEKIVSDVCLHMDLSRYEVVILCFDRYGTSMEQSLEAAGIRLIYISDFLRTKSYDVKGNPALRMIHIMQRMSVARKIVHKEKPDVIHSHLTLNYLVKFCRPSPECTLLHTVHSSLERYWDRKYFSGREDLKAAKWLVKHYQQRFIALHEDMKREIDEMFHVNNTVVLHNGIDFSRFQRSKSQAEVRKQLGIPENAFVTGHIGRFEAVKNHVFLIQVFREVLKRRPYAFLLLTGSGNLLPRIQESVVQSGIQDKVLFLQNRTDIPDILTAMDTFCFPSLYEGMPVSLIEAQKMGVKCVVSTGIPAESVISNLVTRISLESDISEWVNAICEAPPEHISYDHLEDWDICSVAQKLCRIYENEI